MTPLNNSHFLFQVEERISIPPMLDLEFENSKSFRCSECLFVSGCLIVFRTTWLFNSLEKHLIVRVKHSELELDVVSNIWMPVSFSHLINIQVELKIVLDLVILWAWATVCQIRFSARFTSLVMSKLLRSKHSRSFKVPI